ncbi:MAG: alpha-hydroxy-acid oxidizing protein [Peptostreptococcaceae bacterium]|nr:alpha-hydroxy-acid oxidizing protein [Peptostreptococcaceae bacterium]
MNLNEVRDAAREHLKPFCNVCKECNGVYCSGNVPGMGGSGSGNGMKRAYEKLSEIKFHMKTMHKAKDPVTDTELFGRNISLPLLAAPVTGNKYNMGGHLSEAEYCEAIVRGCKEAGTMAMVGDGGDPDLLLCGLSAIKKYEAPGIVIIKPRENDEIIKRIRLAEEAGAIAIGIDIDGAGLVTMALMGQPVGPKTGEELYEIVHSTELPLILKGVMTVEEAKMAVRIGAKAIVVSNHGGRILDDTLAPCEVLPEIAREVKGKLTIMADGSVKNGRDIFKYLALGADMTLSARALIWGAYGNGSEGVCTYIRHMQESLRSTMILTGAEQISDIRSDMIYRDLPNVFPFVKGVF